jgi:hypothetical protein
MIRSSKPTPEAATWYLSRALAEGSGLEAGSMWVLTFKRREGSYYKLPSPRTTVFVPTDTAP